MLIESLIQDWKGALEPSCFLVVSLVYRWNNGDTWWYCCIVVVCVVSLEDWGYYYYYLLLFINLMSLLLS